MLRRNVAGRYPHKYRGLEWGHVTRCVVVYNTDIAWSKTTAEYWAEQHGVECAFFGYPFGTSCVDSNTSGNIFDVSSTRDITFDFYRDFITQVGHVANDINAHGVFMGPATPYYVKLWRDNSQDGGLAWRYRPMPCILHKCKGFTLLSRSEYPDDVLYRAAGNPFSSAGSAIGWSALNPPLSLHKNGEFSGLTIHADAQIFTGRKYPEKDEYFVPLSKYGTSIFKIEKPNYLRSTTFGGFEAGEENQSTLFRVLSDKGLEFEAKAVVIGRIGKPVLTTSSNVRTWGGDETEADTIEIIDEAIANEGDYRTHRDKPIWVGVHDLVTTAAYSVILESKDGAIIYDILLRLGFRNVKYFRRSVSSGNAPFVDLYTPASGQAFAYADIESQTPGSSANLHAPAWALVGYGFRNAEPGDTTPNAGQESNNVSGQDVTNTFDYQPGSFVNMATSSSILHAVRCQNRNHVQPGGVGGVGSIFEPGGSRTAVGVHLWFMNILSGLSLAEAYYASNTSSAVVTDVIGDPLYAPFRYVRDPDIPFQGVNDPVATKSP